MRVRIALLLAMAVLAMPLLSSACALRPSVTTSITSSEASTGTETGSGTAGPSETGTETGFTESTDTSASETDSSTLPSDSTIMPSDTGGSLPGDSQPSDTNTTGAGTAGSGTTGQTGDTTAAPGTKLATGTAASGTTTTRPATTTAPVITTTRPPTQATTAATTTQNSGGSFPVRNYGTFFRNEYGTNANIVDSPDGAVSIDVGSCPQGVVLVKVNTPADGKLWKAIIKGPGNTYQYDLLKRGAFEGVPLQFGSGSYTLTAYEQVSGTSYTPRMAHTFSVSLASSLSPFLASSIIVSFSSSSPSTSRAASLVSGKASQVARIEAVYLWIVQNITYDRALAASITSGQIKSYIPNPDTTMSSRKGICYDFAALMAAMLRSQGIPTRLIMGQVPQGYHAWNEVYIAGTGWVVIASFNYSNVDGSAWVMFDSTFAAGGLSSQTILNTTHTKERTY